MIALIGSISAILLLLNKYFVFKGKRIGWVFGMIGALLVNVYFYLEMVEKSKYNLWIMIVYDFALFVLMLYGYIVSSESYLKEVLKKWNFRLKLGVSFFTLSICVFLLFKTLQADMIVIQFISALCGLVGTLLIAIGTRVSTVLGWLSYLVAHLSVTYLTWKMGDFVFATCQIASAIISVIALKKIM